MLYGNNEARKTASANIHELSVKLANAKPTEDLTLDDIRDIRYYLRTMEDELKREIKRNKTGIVIR